MGVIFACRCRHHIATWLAVYTFSVTRTWKFLNYLEQGENWKRQRRQTRKPQCFIFITTLPSDWLAFAITANKLFKEWFSKLKSTSEGLIFSWFEGKICVRLFIKAFDHASTVVPFSYLNGLFSTVHLLLSFYILQILRDVFRSHKFSFCTETDKCHKTRGKNGNPNWLGERKQGYCATKTAILQFILYKLQRLESSWKRR